MGTTVHKISISLDPEIHAWLTATAKQEGKSLSSVIGDALRMERQNEAALRVVERIGVRATTEEAEALLRDWNKPVPRTPKQTKRADSGQERSWRRRSA